MKRISRICLSVFLAVALLSSMLLPVGAAWRNLDVLRALLSPNGEVWVHPDGYYGESWTQYEEGETPITVYSPDGKMWLTADGLVVYYGEENTSHWNTAVLNSTFSSPDGGQLWFRVCEMDYWYEWDMFWQENPEIPRPAQLWMLTDNPTSYWVHTLSSPCVSLDTGESTVSRFTFSASSCMWTDGRHSPNGLLFSMMQDDFPCYYSSDAQLFPDLWLPELYMQYDGEYPDYFGNWNVTDNAAYEWAVGLQTPVSYDPNFTCLRSCCYGVNENGQNVLYSDYTENPSYLRREVLFKAPCDCEVRLRINFNAPANYYCQAFLPYPHPNSIILNGSQHPIGNSYRPIRAAGAFTDADRNGIIDETEAPGALGDPVYAAGTYYYSEDSFTLYGGTVYSIPVMIWNEGQSAYDAPDNADVNLSLYFELTPLQENAAPFYYTTDYVTDDYSDPDSDTDGVTITGCDIDFLYHGLWGNCTLRETSDYYSAFDFGTQTLTIPDEIGGVPVIRIVDDVERPGMAPDVTFDRTALNSILTEAAVTSMLAAYQDNGFDCLPFGAQPRIRTLLLPDSVRSIEGYRPVLGDTLRTVHVPHDAPFAESVFGCCADNLTICSSSANSVTQQTVGEIRNFRYAVCTNHGGHVHAYTPVVTPPGYLHEGFSRFTCACGDSYIAEPVESLPAPMCAMEGASGNREQSVTVCAQLQHIGALENLTLHLDYDTAALRLDAIRCADEPALPDAETPGDTLCWNALSGADTAVIELTFTILPDAAAGSTSVTVSGSGKSACTSDEGALIPIPAAEASVTVLREAAMRLTVPDSAVHPGETVQVALDMTKNTGLIGLHLSLRYDPAYLTLTNVQTAGMLQSGSTAFSGGDAPIPLVVVWEDALGAANHTETGTILVFTFTVNEIAHSGVVTPVTVNYEPQGVRDFYIQTVPLTVRNASLKINRRINGDASGDGVVDLKDPVLMTRALVGGWNADPDLLNADVDGDGALTLADVILLKRYLAGGWNVTL